jgi:hypothetical protein
MGIDALVGTTELGPPLLLSATPEAWSMTCRENSGYKILWKNEA